MRYVMYVMAFLAAFILGGCMGPSKLYFPPPGGSITERSVTKDALGMETVTTTVIQSGSWEWCCSPVYGGFHFYSQRHDGKWWRW